MAWRQAKSLVVLQDEVWAISPATTIYDIDNTPEIDSDHDPNSAGVVCAIDIMQGHGLDLAMIAEQVRQRENPDLKYVIYNRQIASKSSNPPWSWRAYIGSNPHTDHIHVSVGVGSDGHSVQPYDDEIPWGLETPVGDVFCYYGNDNWAVSVLQMRLKELGQNVTVDNKFGNQTAAAVVALGITGGDATGHTYGAYEHYSLDKLLREKSAKEFDSGPEPAPVLPTTATLTSTTTTPVTITWGPSA